MPKPRARINTARALTGPLVGLRATAAAIQPPSRAPSTLTISKLDEAGLIFQVVERFGRKGAVVTVCDPCCASGGEARESMILDPPTWRAVIGETHHEA